MTVSRRDALKKLAAVPALIEVGSSRLQAGDPRLQAGDPTLVALAEVVLPAESDRKAALAAFAAWIANYKEGADTDHGYGVTRVRATGPSPARTYPAQIAALDAAARGAGAASFAAAPLDRRRAIVEAAVADAKIERLPARPTGGHIATDLMGHYFNSSAANDLCYRAAINRDACRGLAGSENPPGPRTSDFGPRR
jgi:Gluconate 2-dehydrogenase subunit 3